MFWSAFDRTYSASSVPSLLQAIARPIGIWLNIVFTATCVGLAGGSKGTTCPNKHAKKRLCAVTRLKQRTGRQASRYGTMCPGLRGPVLSFRLRNARVGTGALARPSRAQARQLPVVTATLDSLLNTRRSQTTTTAMRARGWKQARRVTGRSSRASRARTAGGRATAVRRKAPAPDRDAPRR